MIPWDVEKLYKKTKKDPDASKEDPRELPRPEMQPEISRKGLQEGARDPRSAPEAQEAILAVREASWGAFRMPPWGSSGGAQIVLFDMNQLHWPPKWRTENQKIFQLILMKKCKKHRIFNEQPLTTQAKRHQQEGP